MLPFWVPFLVQGVSVIVCRRKIGVFNWSGIGDSLFFLNDVLYLRFTLTILLL